ncbi:MAG: hypothetical protein LBE56_12735 [Tannerella sp.]|jgi:hypothetical protein|nr:hypothetical protein [Tannerella sp.]
MYLTNSHTVLSDYGNINKLINFNNEIIGFQDKNIFRVLYNSRVQVPASDGLPIELMQGVKVPEVNYINSLSGTTNK